MPNKLTNFQGKIKIFPSQIFMTIFIIFLVFNSFQENLQTIALVVVSQQKASPFIVSSQFLQKDYIHYFY